MERRQFIKSSCNICLLGSVGMLLPQLTGCSPSYSVFKTEIVNKKLQVPLSLFEKLNFQLIRPAGWYYDIAVQKKDNQQYTALLLRCTHHDTQLDVGSHGYQCSLHGSKFDADGNVRKGPAEHALTQFKTFVQNDQLIIELQS